MTSEESRISLLHGWLGSIVLHGLLTLSFLPLFCQSLITFPIEPFHWDVALIQSAPTADELVQTADTTKSAIPKQPDRIPTTSHPNRTIRHAFPAVEDDTSPAPKIEAPVAQKSATDSPSPVTSQSETATNSIPNELPSTLSKTTEPPRQQTEIPIGSTAQEPPATETVVARANETSSSTTETAPPSLLPTTTTAIDPASIPRPDYGWLQQAIFQRLEELKRSSHPRVDQSQPLKVLVRAVVSHEGTLLDATVVKSSGLDRIDQEAMALVQRAFPIQLDRTLDRHQIAMRIPITYSRE